jgi:hypothetical protein
MISQTLSGKVAAHSNITTTAFWLWQLYSFEDDTDKNFAGYSCGSAAVTKTAQNSRAVRP